MAIIRGQSYTFYVALTSQADANIFQVNPTIAAGDFQVSIDGAALNNLTTLPTVSPVGSRQVEIQLSIAEMSCALRGKVTVVGHDAVGAQWQDIFAILAPEEVQPDEIACDVWACPTRTLTQSAASIISAVTGSTITQTRAVDWTFSITGMGNIAARTTFYFTLKRRTVLPDHEALVQIEETADLMFINGRPAGVAGAANGTLTVTDAIAGDVTITLTAEESAKLSEEAGLDYDFKMITALGAVQQMTAGKFNISSVVTEAIT